MQFKSTIVPCLLAAAVAASPTKGAESRPDALDGCTSVPVVPAPSSHICQQRGTTDKRFPINSYSSAGLDINQCAAYCLNDFRCLSFSYSSTACITYKRENDQENFKPDSSSATIYSDKECFQPQHDSVTFAPGTLQSGVGIIANLCGGVYAEFQDDSDLIVHDPNGPGAATGTHREGPNCSTDTVACQVIFGSEGELVLFRKGYPIYDSNTRGKGTKLVFQNQEPYFYIPDASGHVIYSSNRPRFYKNNDYDKYVPGYGDGYEY